MSTLNPGCGRRRFATEVAAEKAVSKGATGTPEECVRGGLAHWHLTGPAPKGLQAAGGSSIPDQVRKLVVARDGHACVCCGVSIIGRRYSLGHRLRASQLGRAVPSNLITVLGWGGEACHGRIDNRDNPGDEASGYTVRSGMDPALVPVRIARPEGPPAWVWLDDAGNYLYDEPERRAA